MFKWYMLLFYVNCMKFLTNRIVGNLCPFVKYLHFFFYIFHIFKQNSCKILLSRVKFLIVPVVRTVIKWSPWFHKLSKNNTCGCLISLFSLSVHFLKIKNKKLTASLAIHLVDLENSQIVGTMFQKYRYFLCGIV